MNPPISASHPTSPTSPTGLTSSNKFHDFKLAVSRGIQLGLINPAPTKPRPRPPRPDPKPLDWKTCYYAIQFLRRAVDDLSAQLAATKPPNGHASLTISDSVVDEIIRIVASHWSIDPALLTIKDRHENLVWPRYVAMFFAAAFTHYNAARIGLIFTHDRSLVCHGCRKVRTRIQLDPKFESTIDLLRTIITQSIGQVTPAQNSIKNEKDS